MSGLPRIEVMEGEELEWRSDDLYCVQFRRPRRVCSDCCWNGGLNENAPAVANHRMTVAGIDSREELERYCRDVLKGHGLAEASVLQLTGAGLGGAGMGLEDGGGFRVTALVTAGVKENAVWAGDEASYEESTAGEYGEWRPGTINSMIFVDADLTPDALLHVLTVVGECKADELRFRQIRSCYSARMATGTGTDTTTVVCRMGAGHGRTTTSTHSRLGMAVARAARQALAGALEHDTAGAAQAGSA